MPLYHNEVKPREQLTGQVQIPLGLAQELRKEIRNLTHLQAILGKISADQITRFLSILLVASLSLDASDAHIEPEKGGAKIRLRIDGILQDVTSIQRTTYEALLSRIKLLSGLKINVIDKPQDGRFSFTLAQEVVEARVATLPAEYGEAVVLRVLNPKNLIQMSALGLRSDLLSLLSYELRKPNGMILVTGPTGCGKTTTLYAFLKEISKPEIKVITIEDPIEYHLEGISQTQVQPERGYDFASGLQAIIRQDPDVILVGEIRDKATAQIAIQAALTGHLVFSTLHTNDAPGTLSRLMSLGAKAVNVGAACNVIVGQRLVRKVCPHCVKFTKINEAEFTHIKKGLQGVKKELIIHLSPTLKLARTKGCPECNGTSYKGRTGIFEVIIVDSVMEEFITKEPSAAALRKFARQRGMTTMYQDGLLKVSEGTTTLEEVVRTTGEEKI